ncbi:MAG: WbqC family protein [Tannerella sp.]|jgi:hypothetical protein|nr:WbqC family protein [Tannerella sp.]
MATVYLSSAYLAPVQYYCKLFSYESVVIETAENYLKQTYRNRCLIATANGTQALSIPIEKPSTEKCLTKDIRISDHGQWRHLHWHALISGYGTSPFFEYYQDDFAPFYEQKFDYLFDFNEQLMIMICRLVDIQPNITYSSQYEEIAENDFREQIRPKHPIADPKFAPKPYYQVFQEKHGFMPNLSIIDLLFNMGPESLLVLRDSIN